jgi:hypothetical protein
VLALFVCGVCVDARAQDDDDWESISEVRTIARILATSNVRGQLLDPVCDDGELLEPADEGMFTYALYRSVQEDDDPLVIDAGGLLAPSGVMRFAAETNAAALADMVQELGYRAMTFGESELGSPREDMIAVAGELRARGIPMIASNLRCTGDAIALCQQLVDASDGISMHTTLETRVAVLAFLPPEALDRVAPDLAEGLSIAPVERAMERDVREARRLGAELVIAIVTSEVDATVDMVDDLEPEERPDLVILADQGAHLFSVRPTSAQTAMVAPPPDDAAEIVVRDERDLRVPRTIASQPLRMRGISTGEPVLDLADEIGQEYCDAWGRTLPGGHLARPIDPTGVATLAAEIARESAGADIAVLNLDAIDASWEPAQEDALTDSDVYVALQYDEPLVVADVSRAWVEALAHHATERDLITPGLESGTPIRVGGRELVTRAHYRVVTLRFLAEGGDGALEGLDPREVPHWRPLDDATIRSVVDQALQARSELDPRDVREHAGDRPQWLVTGSIDGTFAGSSISNPAAYTVASLNNRQSTVSLGLEVNAGVSASAPDWTWENTLVARYRTQWSPSSTMGQPGSFTPALDQIQLRTTGTWRGFHTATHSHDWYVPDPFIEGFFESEFVQPSSRNYHWLLVRPQAGLRFTLLPELDIKLDVGFQTQALAAGLLDSMGNREDSIDGGVGAVVTLRPFDLIHEGDRHTTIAGTADFFWSDPFTRNLWQLRGALDAQVDLAGPLSLSLGVRLYLQEDGQHGLGAAVDATAGFRLSGIGRLVGP